LETEKRTDRLVEIYREFGERSTDIMLFFRTDGTIVHANPAALQAYGYTLEEITGLKIYDIRAEKSWPDIPREMQQAMQRSFRFETTHRRRDGSDFPVETTWTFAELEGSAVVLSLIRDVSDRKRTLAELQESEERYRDFVARSTEGVYRLEFNPPIDISLPYDQQIDLCYDNGRLAECNEAFARMYGFENCDEIVGETLQLMLPREVPEVREYIRSLMEAGYKADGVESAERDRFGNPVYFENSLTGVVENGSLTRVWGTQRDITERKLAEERAAETHRTFIELVERCPFGIYIVDEQFKIYLVNSRSAAGAFRNVDPLVGRDFDEAMRIVWPEEVARDVIERFRRTMETGEPFRSEDFLSPRGDIDAVESYEWELHRIVLPDGRPGVVCYYFDSTELRDARNALDEANLRIEAEGRVGRLLSRVVNVQEDERHRLARDLHDHLGQQVTALRINLSALMESLGKDGPAMETACTVDRLAADLDASIDALTWELRPAALEEYGLAAALKDLVNGWSSRCGISAEFNTKGDAAVQLPANAEVQLYRVTQEALQNVYKHSGARRAKVTLTPADEVVTLEIADDGNGFDPASARDRDCLGLTSMEERSALIGGSFSVTASPGAGTCIRVEVPIEDRQRSPEAVTETA
jgi:PAS domain S-box-containing protein